MIKCQILTVVLGLIVIVLGGSLYIFYRSESLALFEWVRAVGMYDWVDSMRPEEDIDSWLVYSLPDGLWLLSYILFMAALRNFDIRESYGPQFDIPFMIYLTPKYAKEHPELAARLKAARQRRF